MKRELLGIHRYENGDLYLGEWKNNTRCGHGIYLYNKTSNKRTSIQMFMGKWLNDKPEKEGVFLWLDEPENNNELNQSSMEAYVGQIEDGNFKRGIYLAQKEKFFIYYGDFENNKKHDPKGFFFDNNGEEDRVFRGKIVNDVVQDGFFVTFHSEGIENTVFFKFKEGELTDVAQKKVIDENTLKKINEECFKFRETLYEDDWFSMVYFSCKEAYSKLRNFKREDFQSEEKFNQMVKVATSFKNVTVYSHMCEKMAK